ncbi:MAG TPA: hypothetical protein VHO48_00150 [Anaerolineaceae bacterium]|nr:hypothetical protein [Anaerolineaceae bacterium]
MAEQFTPPPGPVEEFPSQPVTPATPPKKNNTTLWIIIAVVVVLLCCCCVVAAVVLYNNWDTWIGDLSDYTSLIRMVI